MSYQLVTGDCREVLATMKDASVDCVVTDIPYNQVNRPIGDGFDKVRSFDKGEADSTPVNVRWVARELARVCCGSIYVWCAQEQLSALLRAFQGRGLTTRSIVWEKTDPSPINGQYLWLSGIEMCAFARNSNAWFGRFCRNTVLRGPIERNIDWHPTPKPVWLMRELVTASCPVGGTVLDPFMGSGSVGYAALSEGRRFIGIERNATWAEKARLRLNAAPYPSLMSELGA